MFSGRKTTMAARGPGELSAEAKRLETLLKDLTKKLNDPDVPLSAMMRLTISQNELLAYLRGIRYALGEEEAPYEIDQVESKAG
jgi:hypothetical protein